MKYEQSSVSAQCPVCGHDDCCRLYTVTPADAAQHYVLREVDRVRHDKLVRHIRELWKNEDCALVRCGRCQFVFAMPFTGGDSEFYFLAYTYGAEKYPRDKWEYDEAICCLAHRLGRRNRYLEIGAGSGAFVKKLIPDFVQPEDATCIEYSRNGSRAMRAMGIECLDQDVCAAPGLNGRQFDIICLFQVLEHMADLDRVFSRLYELAAPGCDIVIAVPNPLRTEFQELNGSVLDLPPNHVGRWTPRCFQIMTQRFGLSLVACSTNRTQSFQEKAKRFVKFTYQRRAQKASLANRVEQLRNPGLKMLFRMLVAGVYALEKLPVVLQCAHPELGDSLLAHLRRPLFTEDRDLC
jgi:SAM-dependent methyltransferase